MKLGEFQTLTVVKKVDFGVYLADTDNSEERVLLPAAQVPSDTKIGDELKVFLYKDSQDRLISTVREPKITLGQYAVLSVLETNKIGAFLDWGLEKDLFLPYKEQLVKVKAGDEILVSLYIDKSDRLCATMRGLYHLLSTRSPYQKDDMVKARVYEFSDNFGAFLAVDDRYSGRIANSEDHSNLRIGQVVEARVLGVKEDGKLDLTLRERAYVQMDADAEKVLGIIEEYAGVLPFNDKATPETIKRVTGLSKNAFKRAVGRLYKERKIEIGEKTIRRV
ncbi:MAG: RNA-binding protein [Eubacterium sp.]|nr:RNA-binding protein [Eubacterium sp.]